VSDWILAEQQKLVEVNIYFPLIWFSGGFCGSTNQTEIHQNPEGEMDFPMQYSLEAQGFYISPEGNILMYIY
jgi:hypothetical protein